MDKLIIFGAQSLIWVIVFLAGIYFAWQPKKQQKEMLVLAMLALPIVYVAAKIGSFLYFDPQPFVVDNFVPLIAHTEDNGFPSDHTLLSASAAMIVFFFKRRVGIALLTLAFLVGFFRVLAGVHHAVDIFGSVGFAIIFVWLARKYLLPAILQTKIYKRYLS
ncbi:MAG: hypothetical protein UT50_C0002G0017 [Candidatus Moranbacteria bacterium GW2011_GWA2_39_41]|nr:MAG: hypothetical protein UT50_C0002G0017 [Candidatus Moranbacteria bacterium GW2011_GWA2_39_41]